MRAAHRLVLAAAAGLVACDPPRPGVWQAEAFGHRWRELGVAARGGPGFEPVSPAQAGIDFANMVDRAEAARSRHLTHGSGVALGDVDGDGLPDVFLARLHGPNALYRNLGGWRFEDVTRRSGTAAADRLSTGAVLVDVDGDLDVDLLLTALGGPNAVFVNDGTGVFAERPLDSVPDSTGSTTLALADVDGDGALDLYVANYKLRSALDTYAPAQRRFEEIVQEIDGGFRVAPGYERDFRVFERPDLDAVGYVQRAEADAFYLNDGRGGFGRVAFTSGRFLDPEGAALTEEPDLFALSARFHDVDGDLDPDLFVTNDFEDPDLFFLNDNGTFRALPPLALRTTSNAGMAVDFSDVDRDGDVDIFEVDMLGRDRERRIRQVPTHTALPKQIGRIDDRPQRMRNTLFLNRGDGSFAQIAEYAGVDASDWSWATMFLDVDLDGYEDILVTTGHAWDIMDADTQRRLGTLDYDWREEFLLFPDLDQPNRAFRNNGDLTFREIGSEWGFGTEADVSHGIAAADLDLDGDQDLVVTRLNAAPLLLRNETTAARIHVRALGEPPNTQGIGAVVSLSGPGVPVQQKEITAGGMYLSGSDPTVTFAAAVDADHTLTVRWRSGRVSTLEGVRANRGYEVREPDAPPATITITEVPEIFEDVSVLLGHRHTETEFDDFQRQPLLPNQLGRLGPGLTWHDVDRDGREDLLVPTGTGGRLSVLGNTGSGFTESAWGPEARLDQTMALPVPDGRGGARLLVGRASYEAASPDEAFTTPSVVVMSGAGAYEPAIPGDTASAGALAAADVDGDGDLDLFVAARVVPAAYPLAGSSRIYLAESEGYRLDEGSRAALRGLGMVSGATFSDVDDDGDPDLLAAIEWGAVTLLLNDGGRFTRAGAAWGLDALRGRWNGVTTGDMDGDGRMDVIATNWGENVRPRPEPDRPLALLFGDFDRSGSLDLIRSQRDDAVGGWVPLDRFERLSSAIPALAKRVPSVAEYAAATVDDLFGAALDVGGRYEATTYQHMLFLNRGGRFEARPLPVEAQLAPAFHAGVADFDADGHEDVFLTQNFFPTDRDSPRLDAGVGLWLRGDGQGGLTPVPPSVSGVRVWGDARGAALADYDLDGRVDLAVAQNGAETKLFRNRAPVYGLRVRLVGPPSNPTGVGARLRMVYPDGRGPAREIRAGSGYWSVDGAAQVLGGLGRATSVWVRWPDGVETTAAILGPQIVVDRGGR